MNSIPRLSLVDAYDRVHWGEISPESVLDAILGGRPPGDAPIVVTSASRAEIDQACAHPRGRLVWEGPIPRSAKPGRFLVSQPYTAWKLKNHDEYDFRVGRGILDDHVCDVGSIVCEVDEALDGGKMAIEDQAALYDAIEADTGLRFSVAVLSGDGRESAKGALLPGETLDTGKSLHVWILMRWNGTGPETLRLRQEAADALCALAGSDPAVRDLARKMRLGGVRAELDGRVRVQTAIRADHVVHDLRDVRDRLVALCARRGIDIPQRIEALQLAARARSIARSWEKTEHDARWEAAQTLYDLALDVRLGGVALPSHRALLEAVGAPTGKVRVTYSPGAGGPAQSREITTGVGEGWDATTTILTHASGASGTAETLWGTHSRGYRIPDVHCLRHADAHASAFVSRWGDYAPYRWALVCPTCGRIPAAYEGRRKGDPAPEIASEGTIISMVRPSTAPPVVIPAGPTFEAQVEAALQAQREEDAAREAAGLPQLATVWESYSEDGVASPRGARRVQAWSERTSTPFDPLAIDEAELPDGLSDAEKVEESENHARTVLLVQALSAHADKARHDLSLEVQLGYADLDDRLDGIYQDAYGDVTRKNTSSSNQPKVELEAGISPDFSALIYRSPIKTTIYTSAEKTPHSEGSNSTLERSESGVFSQRGSAPAVSTPVEKTGDNQPGTCALAESAHPVSGEGVEEVATRRHLQVRLALSDVERLWCRRGPLSISSDGAGPDPHLAQIARQRCWSLRCRACGPELLKATLAATRAWTEVRTPGWHAGELAVTDSTERLARTWVGQSPSTRLVVGAEIRPGKRRLLLAWKDDGDAPRLTLGRSTKRCALARTLDDIIRSINLSLWEKADEKACVIRGSERARSELVYLRDYLLGRVASKRGDPKLQRESEMVRVQTYDRQEAVVDVIEREIAGKVIVEAEEVSPLAITTVISLDADEETMTEKYGRTGVSPAVVIKKIVDDGGITPVHRKRKKSKELLKGDAVVTFARPRGRPRKHAPPPQATIDDELD